MNKTELDHIKDRVEKITQCTCGEIATIMNRLHVGTRLTASKKYEMIRDGRAAVLEEHELVKLTNGYRKDNHFEILLECFEYPETTRQKEKREINERIDRKTEELIQEVTLEGKRLIDNIVLSLVRLEDIPDELHKLGSMTTLARQFKKSQFVV